MGMSLYWSPRSPFVRKVMVAAYEKGVADQIELVETAMPTDDRRHPLFRHNPLGRIPALVLDDGRTIHGSSVICEYLDQLVEPSWLFPGNPQERLHTRMREALGDGLMETLYGWVFELFNPTERSPAIMARQAHKLHRTLDALEHEASALSREPFDVGHIAIAAALAYIDFRLASEDWRAGHKGLADWFEAIALRDSMVRTAFAGG